MVLTEGSSPRRRYACFSSDDEQHFGVDRAQADTPSGQSPMAPQDTGLHPQHSSMTLHKVPCVLDSAEYFSARTSGEPLITDALSEGAGSMMNLDNGVSSPGAKAGSDASMISCSSSEDGHEVDSADVQNALVGRKRSSSKLNPPKEEDRTLPLKKLFENLSELTDIGHMDELASGPLSNGSSSSVYAGTLSCPPKAASVAGDLPRMDLQVHIEQPPDSFRDWLAASDKAGSMSESQTAAARGFLLHAKSGAASNGARSSPMRHTDSPVHSPLPSPIPGGRNPWGSGSSSVHNGGAFSNRGMLLHNLSQVGTHAHVTSILAIWQGRHPLYWQNAL